MYASGFLVIGLLCSQATAVLGSDNAPYKGFSGIRVDPNSIQKVFHHDQTIAVVELDGEPGNLINCELIEINPQIEAEALKDLTQTLGTPTTYAFLEMKELMQICHGLTVKPLTFPVVSEEPAATSSMPLETNTEKKKHSGGRLTALKKKFGLDSKEPADTSSVATSPLGTNPERKRHSAARYTVIKGIFPGTKWCGTGDIAETYHDLGSEQEMDKCCRTHDLCPVKLQPSESRYGLQNDSFYTKSHCDCDDMLRDCLKTLGHSKATTVGTIYFDMMHIACLEDVPATDGDADSSARSVRRFRPSKKYRHPEVDDVPLRERVIHFMNGH